MLPGEPLSIAVIPKGEAGWGSPFLPQSAFAFITVEVFCNKYHCLPLGTARKSNDSLLLKIFI